MFVAHLVVRVPCELMCLEHKHVHQRGLSMMQVADHSNIANELGERSHVQQEPEANL